MKYIIMCGGEYAEPIPKQLFKVNGEELTARTIRLLKQEGIDDISISSNNPVFDKFGIPRLEHVNTFGVAEDGELRGLWVDAFYPLDEPACYVFGDVLFSDKAIHKIVTTETNDVEFLRVLRLLVLVIQNHGLSLLLSKLSIRNISERRLRKQKS